MKILELRAWMQGELNEIEDTISLKIIRTDLENLESYLAQIVEQTNKLLKKNALDAQELNTAHAVCTLAVYSAVLRGMQRLPWPQKKFSLVDLHRKESKSA